MYNKRLVFWSACMGILLFGMGLITLGSVVPNLKEKFQLDEISTGALFSILPFGILIGSLIFGPFCDKYGYKILLALSCICMFAGFEGIAYAPSHFILKVCIFLIGLGGGAINGATSALVSDISEKDKGANLSLLGVFFGIGALGMPSLLGILENRFNFEVIISVVGIITFFAGIFYLLIKFPPPKHSQGFPISQSLTLLKDSVLIMIAFFLFFQSSFEAIINNWTTTYLTIQLGIHANKALYALSSFVAGMAGMRLLLGSVFRDTSVNKLWMGAFTLIATGLILLAIGRSFLPAVIGLVLLGAGLAGGFPLMLGFVGNRYKELSGTAFSLVFVIALAGNMLINYGMGIIAQTYGIQHLITVAFIELMGMVLLCYFILNRLKHNKSKIKKNKKIMLAKQWLTNTREIMARIEDTQMDNIKKAAVLMADSIESERWVHTFGCGHATIPIEEMYPRIGGFVGFHPIVELPLTFFTNITGQMGVHQFIFLERVEGYGVEIMKGYTFDSRDTMWLFSHTGINNVNIDVALEAKKKGMKVVVFGSASEAKGKKTRHSSGKNIFEIADIVVDTCAPIEDASVSLKNHVDKIGPVSTMAFITCVWMTVTTVAEILEERGVKLYIHPSHNAPGAVNSKERLDEALDVYKTRVTGV